MGLLQPTVERVPRPCGAMDLYSSSSVAAAGQQPSSGSSSPSTQEAVAVPAAPARHEPRQPAQGRGPAHCQVANCREVLTKSYCVKKKTCTAHMQAGSVQLTDDDPTPYRFCQQCGRFEQLQKFDDNKRSCRARLAKRRSGTRAQLLKKGCTVRADSGSNGSAGADAVAACDIASDELPELFREWGERDAALPAYSMSARLPPSVALERDTPFFPRVYPLAPPAVCAPRCGLLDGAAGQGLALSAQAAQLQAFSLQRSGADGAAAAGIPGLAAADTVPPAGIARCDILQLPSLSLGDDAEEFGEEPMAQADLMAALQMQQSAEGDRGAWPADALPAATAPGLLGLGSFTAATSSGLGSSALAPAATARATDASFTSPLAPGDGAGLRAQLQEASGCSVRLSKLCLAPDGGQDGPALDQAPAAARLATAPLPKLGSNASSAHTWHLNASGSGCASGGTGLSLAAAAAAAGVGPTPRKAQSSISAQLQTLASLPSIGSAGVGRARSQRSAQLSWLVQQLQQTLEDCTANDLEDLGPSGIETLLHVALVPRGEAQPAASAAPAPPPPPPAPPAPAPAPASLGDMQLQRHMGQVQQLAAQVQLLQAQIEDAKTGCQLVSGQHAGVGPGDGGLARLTLQQQCAPGLPQQPVSCKTEPLPSVMAPPASLAHGWPAAPALQQPQVRELLLRDLAAESMQLQQPQGGALGQQAPMPLQACLGQAQALVASMALQQRAGA